MRPEYFSFDPVSIWGLRLHLMPQCSLFLSLGALLIGSDSLTSAEKLSPARCGQMALSPCLLQVCWFLLNFGKKHIYWLETKLQANHYICLNNSCKSLYCCQKPYFLMNILHNARKFLTNGFHSPILQWKKRLPWQPWFEWTFGLDRAYH